MNYTNTSTPGTEYLLLSIVGCFSLVRRPISYRSQVSHELSTIGMPQLRLGPQVAFFVCMDEIYIPKSAVGALGSPPSN